MGLEISDFLWDRSIRVKYNNCLSDPFAIRQGVPQGSVLSPVLFSLYITGTKKVLAKHCEVGIVADDIIVWSSGSNVGENELKLNRAMEEADSTEAGEKGISGSGVCIPTPSGALEFKIKNPNYSSVFRSEHIVIRRGLQCAAQLEDRFQEIWILTHSRALIQHLANWGDIGDQTSLDILSLLHDLSSGHSIHFQWIPSHVGIEGNERADFWLGLLLCRVLSSRPLQSTYSRFLSGHKSSQVQRLRTKDFSGMPLVFFRRGLT
ncbi:putative RNA-directed DNA polymerase from transposon BS [Trichonephila clavipes]|nr:putative RNA-directed DNA polymerase from transposon BS [Trichonephila clavipes]